VLVVSVWHICFCVDSSKAFSLHAVKVPNRESSNVALILMKKLDQNDKLLATGQQSSFLTFLIIFVTFSHILCADITVFFAI